MKIEVTVPQAVVDDYKSSDNYRVLEGESDQAFMKRVMVNLLKKNYVDVRSGVIWKESKDFIKGNQDGIK